MVITELRRMYWRPATLMVALAMVTTPILLLMAVRFGDNSVGFSARYLADLSSSSGMNFLAFSTLVFTQIGVTLMVAYFFGESVAREAEWGTLRVVLTAPVNRLAVLLRKAAAAGIVTAAMLVLFTVAAGMLGVAVFGAGAMSLQAGDEIAFGAAASRFILVIGYLLLANIWLAALGMLASVLMGRNTLAAVSIAAVVALTSHVFGALPFLGQMRALLPTRNYAAWVQLLHSSVNQSELWWGAFLSLFYGLVLLTLAGMAIHSKNIRV